MNNRNYKSPFLVITNEKHKLLLSNSDSVLRACFAIRLCLSLMYIRSILRKFQDEIYHELNRPNVFQHAQNANQTRNSRFLSSKPSEVWLRSQSPVFDYRFKVLWKRESVNIQICPFLSSSILVTLFLLQLWALLVKDGPTKWTSCPISIVKRQRSETLTSIAFHDPQLKAKLDFTTLVVIIPSLSLFSTMKLWV